MQFCSNCDSSRSEYSCLDCPVLERNFCARCCDLHTKVKSTKAHRLILSGPKFQIVTETTNKVIIKTHSNDGHDKKLSSVDLTSVQASCSRRSFCPCKDFLCGDIIPKIGHIAHKVRSVFTALVDTTDFFALLAFFEIDTVLEKFPLAYALIPTMCLLALVMMFSSELITKNGSSIAVIVGAIAFLQRSRWSSGSSENNSANVPIHTNRKKNSLCVTSAQPFDRIQNSNLLTSGSLHAHNYRIKKDEVNEDVGGSDTEDSRAEGSEVGTETDEEDFKDEFYYRRHKKVTLLPEKSGMTHYRKNRAVLKR